METQDYLAAIKLEEARRDLQIELIQKECEIRLSEIKAKAKADGVSLDKKTKAKTTKNKSDSGKTTHLVGEFTEDELEPNQLAVLNGSGNIKAADAARLLGISRNTFSRHAKRKSFTCHQKTEGGTIWVDRKSVVEWDIKQKAERENKRR